MKKIVYEGVLELYFATGEGTHVTLFMNEDKYRRKNENYDPKNPSTGPEFYHSFEGTIFTKKMDEIEIIDCEYEKYNGTKFTLGNLKVAAQDGYQLGICYPLEEVNLNEWKKITTSSKTKARLSRTIKKVAYYGGSFDPIHMGHREIIRDLTYFNDLVLVMPSNNWTKHPPLFSIDERINSVKAVCDQWPNVKVLEWAKDNKIDTSSTLAVVEEIEQYYQISPHIVIGSDNVKGIEKWKNWENLKKRHFVIFSRNKEKLQKEELAKFDQPPMISEIRSYQDVSSTNIRLSYSLNNVPSEALKFLDLKKLSQNKN